jgi:hypothetical protein
MIKQGLEKKQSFATPYIIVKDPTFFAVVFFSLKYLKKGKIKIYTLVWEGELAPN